MDGCSSRIFTSIEFEAADETEALAFAEERRCQPAMELWNDGGLLKRWNSFPQQFGEEGAK
jgi:hypothetical protein